MEKFAVAKADRFLAQGNQLVLPALELIYVWNGFKILGKSWEMMEPVFLLVEKCLKDIELNKGNMRQLFVNMIFCLMSTLVVKSITFQKLVNFIWKILHSVPF